MDIKCSEEQIIGAPVPLDPLAPKRAEEEFIHSFFNAEPYWWGEAEEEEEEAGQKEASDSTDAPAPKPIDDAPIEDITLESDESD